VNEAVYRQANRVTLRQKLDAARDAQERGDMANASKLYDDAWELIVKIGSGVEAETAQTRAGLGVTPDVSRPAGTAPRRSTRG
jgi:hypothetical protein